MSDPLDALWFLCEQELGTQERMSAAVDKAKAGGTDLGGGQVKAAGRAGLEIGRKPQQKPDLSGGAKQADSGDYLVAGKPQDKVGKVDTSDPQAMIKRTVDTARQSGVPYPTAVQQTTGSPPPIDTPQAKAAIATGMGASSQANDKPGRDNLQQGRTDDSGAVSVSASIHDMEGKDEVSQQNLQEPGRSETDSELQDGEKIKASGSQPAGDDEPSTAGQAVAQKSSDPNKTLDSMVDEPEEDIDPGQIDDEEQYENSVESIDDDLSAWQTEVDEYLDKMIEGKGQLTERQRKNVDAKYGPIREKLKNIKGGATRDNMRQAMALGSTYVGRVNSGAGKNSIGMIDHETLLANKDRLIKGYGDGSPGQIKKFVDTTRTVEVDDETAELFYEILPEKLQNSFGNAGSNGTTYDGHFLGYNEDGSVKRGTLGGKNGKSRGLIVAKLLLQQGFRDAYTGLPLDPNQIDLEHVVGFKNNDKGKPTQQDRDDREHLDNFVIIASNVNQTKSDNNMINFFDKSIHTLDNFDEEDFSTRDELFSSANTITSTAAKVGKYFIKDNKLTLGELRKMPLDELIAPNITKENFDAYTKNDRRLIQEINKDLKAFAKRKKIKASNAPKVQSRMGYDLFKNLGLTTSLPKPPTFNSDGVIETPGRGSQSKFDDRIYSAVLSTALGEGPKALKSLKGRWNEEIKTTKDYMGTYNPDGPSGYKFFINNLIKKGLISEEFLKDDDFVKLLSEEYGIDCGEFLTETIDFDYNDDVDFLRKYGRA
jgi:hypothetical protein